MENNQSQKSNIVNETKGRGLFYGVIAIATFIIMAVGATFAYFTATTSSMNSAVQTGSTTLELEYISYGEAWKNDELIPVDTIVAEYSFERQDDTTVTDEASRSNTICVDDDGNEICSIYVFQVVNTAKSEQEVSIDVISETNGFASLHAMAYEIALEEKFKADYESTESSNGVGDPVFMKTIDDTTPGAIKVEDGDGKQLTDEKYDEIYVNRKGVTKTLLQYTKSINADNSKNLDPAIERPLKVAAIDDGKSVEERTAKIADTVRIPGSSTKTFALVLYILNKDENQTGTDASKSFTGQVVVGSGDGVGVSGNIGLAKDVTDLDSQVQSGGTTQEPSNENEENTEEVQP